MCLAEHALFFILDQPAVPVIRRYDDGRPEAGRACGGNINFLAAGSDMRTEHVKGCPESAYLALFFPHAEFERLACDDFDPATLSLHPRLLEGGTLLRPMLDALATEMAQPRLLGRLVADQAMLIVLAEIARQAAGAQPPRPASGGLAPYQLRRVTEKMLAAIDHDFSLSELAQSVGLSATYFCRAFKQSLGMPPHRWLIDQRIQWAQRLMRTTDMPLADIAVAAGFADQSHLTTSFRKLVGVTPSAWRRAVKQ